MNRRIRRRNFLRGAGSLAVGLPFLESLGGFGRSPLIRGSGGPLQSGGFPKRFVVFWQDNGTHPSLWFPKGSGSDYTMSPYLQPLEAQRDKILILKGIDMPSGTSGAGDDHIRGCGASLTGTETVEVGGDDIGGGISIDQRIANEIGDATKFRSLELGVQSFYNGHTVYERIAYRGKNQPLPPERDPSAVFKRLFSDLNVDPGNDSANLAAERLLDGRRSVLDHVASDHQKLLSKLGATDRAKLDDHLTAIREVEKRLTVSAPPTTGTQCSVPDLGDSFDYSSSKRFGDVGRLQMDLLAMALACDLTRVSTVMWSYGRSKHVFNHLDAGISEEFHALSHKVNPDSGSSPDRKDLEQNKAIHTFYAEQTAYFIQKLSEIPEGDGTVLDNTIFLWCNALGEGREHTHTDIPIVVAGGGGGALRPGRLLDYDGRSTNDLFVALLQAMGIDDDSFGNPEHNKGPLPDLG